MTIMMGLVCFLVTLLFSLCLILALCLLAKYKGLARCFREKVEIEKKPNLRRIAGLLGVITSDETEDVLDSFLGKPVLSDEDKKRKKELDEAFIGLREISRELSELGSKRDRYCDVIWKYGFVPKDFGYDYSPRPKGMDPYFLPEILWAIPSHGYHRNDGRNPHLRPPNGFRERGTAT